MEKLCQAFEAGEELVELSQASPHDISNVLKLYLRQVCWGGAGAGLAQGGRGCALTHAPPHRSCLSHSYPFGSTMSLWGLPRTA